LSPAVEPPSFPGVVARLDVAALGDYDAFPLSCPDGNGLPPVESLGEFSDSAAFDGLGVDDVRSVGVAEYQQALVELEEIDLIPPRWLPRF
jgi:hypothetical protein